MDKKELLNVLRQQGIKNPEVLEAIRQVPRENFVVEAYQTEAYENTPLPLGLGQTISQPYIVAYMTEQLMPLEGKKVLEIGTGSGYQAAILAQLGAHVYSIERIPELAHGAEKSLISSGFHQVHLKISNGHLGWPRHSPFDAIIVTATSHTGIPQLLVQQLTIGGQMMIPMRDLITQQEYLYLITRTHLQEVQTQQLIGVRFVPLVDSD